MSLIAVVPDHHCDFAVLYASEAHYLVDRSFSYVTLELATRSPEDCARMTVALDGALSSASELARLHKASRFKSLLKMSSVTQEPDARGIWDYRQTFFQPRAVTNKGYEGPSRDITTLRDDEEVLYVGTPTLVPRAAINVEQADHLSFLLLGAPLRANRLHAFRLGFFLTRHEIGPRSEGPRAWLVEQLRAAPKTTFVTRFFNYDTRADAHHLRRFEVVQRMDRVSLGLTLEPFAQMNGWDVAQDWNTATSDIWVVGWGEGSVALRSPRDLESYPQAGATRWGLFPQEEPASSSPLWDLHLQPGKHVPGLHGAPTTHVREDVVFELEEIAWDTSVPGLTLAQIYRELSSESGLPALILALLVPFLQDQGRVAAAVLAVLYLGYLLWRLRNRSA